MKAKRRMLSVFLIVALITGSLFHGPVLSVAAEDKIVDFNDQKFPDNWELKNGVLRFDPRDDEGEDFYLRYHDTGSPRLSPIRAFIKDAPIGAAEVEFSFDWLPERARAGNACTYISLRDGDNVIIEFVNIGNWDNVKRSELAYNIGAGTGSELSAERVVIDSTMNDFHGGPNNNPALVPWYNVKGTVDFVNKEVTFTIKNLSGGESKEISADIPDSFKTLNTLEMGFRKWGSNNQSNEFNGLDNVFFSYKELTTNDIVSINQPKTQTIFLGDKDKLILPTEVVVSIADDSELSMLIDDSSWDNEGYEGGAGTFTYTADLIVPNDYTNSKNLKVSFLVVYNDYGRRDAIRIVDMPANVNVYAEDYEAFEFPKSVLVVFGDESIEEVALDENSWTSVPEFNKDIEGVYQWNGSLSPKEGDKDPRKIPVSFTMNYVLDKPNYDLFYDFTLGVWSGLGLGKDVHAGSGTGYPTLTHITEGDNSYMHVNPNSSNWRMQSMPGLSTDSRKGTIVSFDWKPISAPSGQFGEIVFISSANTFPYFGLQFGNDMELKYYNVGVNDGPVTVSPEVLKTPIAKNNASGTGIIANGSTWYSVTIDFDYFAHTADLKIVAKNEPNTSLFEKTIDIYPSTVNASRIGMGGVEWKWCFWN